MGNWKLARWQERDPITLLGAKLADDGTLPAPAQNALREKIQEEIDLSAERAKQAPYPTIEEIRPYVYAA